MGAKKFVLFGSCGVLDDDKVKDRIIVPVSAVRDEGTSYHYVAPSPEIEADSHSIQILENVLKNCGYPYVKGKTWTSDAIYRETIPAIQEPVGKAVLQRKWNALPCWQSQNTGRSHLSSFYMERTILVLINGKSGILICMALPMRKNTWSWPLNADWLCRFSYWIKNRPQRTNLLRSVFTLSSLYKIL